MFATGDVLEVTAVALDTLNSRHVATFTRSATASASAGPTTPFDRDRRQRHRGRTTCSGGDGGRFELVDAVAVIDRDDEVALCGERRGTLGRVAPTSGDVSRTEIMD